MLGKAIGAIFILLLMTQVIFAQQDSGGSTPYRPSLHYNGEKASRTKEQKEYEKGLDREYQSELKKIPDGKKRTDPWGDIRSAPGSASQK